MNSKTKGSISELRVAAKLLELGFTVLQPIGENSRYDLVAEKDNQFHRIQVKTGRLRNGCILFSTKSQNHTSAGVVAINQYTKNEIDFFAVYEPNSNRIYMVPVEEVTIGECTLRVDKPLNAQQSNIRWASTFEV